MFSQGDQFSQIVIGFDPDMDPAVQSNCGLVINLDNWLNILRVPLVAKVDGAVDGDQIRLVSFYGDVIYTTDVSITSIIDIGVVTVSVILQLYVDEIGATISYEL